jgi:hypothetical protein
MTARAINQAKRLIDNPFYDIDDSKIYLKFYHNNKFNN